jgi:hypothetical protein
VDLAGERRRGAGATGDVVPLGEPDQVGLVDRDRRDPELTGRPGRLVAEGRGRGDVDDVGAEAQHRGAQPAAGLEPEPEVLVERQVRATGPAHAETGIDVRPGGRDELGGVALGSQVLENAAYRVGHTVDLREERLADDEDSHTGDARNAGPTNRQTDTIRA